MRYFLSCFIGDSIKSRKCVSHRPFVSPPFPLSNMTVISQSNGCYFAADGQREGCQGVAAAVMENKGGRG